MRHGLIDNGDFLNRDCLAGEIPLGKELDGQNYLYSL